MTPELILPVSHYAERVERLRRSLAAMSADVAMITLPASQYWLTGYDTFLGAQIPQAIILTPGNDEPTLVVWDADVAIARGTSVLQDIRTFRYGVDQPAELMANVARHKAPDARRVALELSASAMTFSFVRAFEAAFGSAELVDVGPALGRMRVVKSAAEISLMRAAGAHARAGLAAAHRHAQPGITEIELAGEIEYAMRRSGSDYYSIPTELTSGPRTVFGHGTPTARMLAAGDIMHVEIGGVERRYNCVGIQTFAVPGAKPPEAALRLYDVALRCLRAGLERLGPGIPAPDVEAPALDVLRGEGLGDVFKMRFGYGVGIGYPPSWLEPLQITRASADILERGMTFVMHVCLIDEATSTGVLVGGTYAITDGGHELLSGAGDVEIKSD
jgi:Xaa-Pro dipeptidase